ncbi:MAG: hypothetical protein FJ255_12040 [Phycisphaerae bacterium]|nr:hypothetical protein [Phycisphaerae bacterium]
MTHMSASEHVAPECRIPPATGHPALAAGNVTIDAASARSAVRLLLGVGAVGVGLAIAGGFVANGKHALAALLVGNMAVLSICAVAMILTMAFHLVNAGWWAGFRRQIENIATLTPVFGATTVAIAAADYYVLGGSLWGWMGTQYAATDLAYLLEKKSAYLNVPFFFGRAAVYVVVWAILTQVLFRLSRKADAAPDPSLTARARFTSAWGILVGALTVAFASYDWIMGLDFRFFSTMFPVRFFAAGAFAGVAVLVLVLVLLRRRGRLEGVIGAEHYHDLGKLMFAFTVFWAYIAYFEYFLYWYGNIPEETAYFTERATGAWKPFFYALCFGHFAAPFLILIFRGVKRNPRLLTLVALWAVFIHVIDMVFLIRPMVYAGVPAAQNPGLGALWIDIAGAVGMLALFGGLLARRIGSGPLVGVNDPRMTEALEHKNYV